ncbi:hypothetical protein BJF92_14430 [Rhizobium rhizosphaerae]|uniref:Uncharacterized protein n=1 Tax=Xaviernesmea rhizosphaerae TaxID=1672749 RepID=A0A1Q9ACJ2_9HYPH|nr:hypothetical protein BJF92_14430 [Xaviernesmea rhizosphaerae]
MVFTYGSFDGYSDYVAVGDFIGFGLDRYLIASIRSDGFSLSTTSGGAVNFPANTERTWRYTYDIRRGACNIRGNSIIFIDGDFFFSFFYDTRSNKLKIGNTWYSVTQIIDPRQLKIDTNLGNQDNIAFIQKTHIEFASGLRTQSLMGSREENAFIGVTDKGEMKIDLQGFVNGAVPREMPLIIGGALSYDANGLYEHLTLTADGKLGVGEPRDVVRASPARTNSFVVSSAAQGGTKVRVVSDRKRASFNGDIRLVDTYFENDYGGAKIQSRTAVGTSSLALNPEGGNVLLGGPVVLNGVGSYADDAAAASAGVPSKGLYRRSSDGVLMMRA